jgi:proteasome lid subunit RPN8/RPN11
MDIDVTREVLRAVQSAAVSAHPFEACGLLLGTRDNGRAAITAFTQTANVHPEPRTHFEIDPSALIDAHRDERSGGRNLLGYYHSHPSGDPRPSATDRASSAGDGRIWAIIGGINGAERDIMFWEDGAEGFNALSYAVIGD